MNVGRDQILEMVKSHAPDNDGIVRLSPEEADYVAQYFRQVENLKWHWVSQTEDIYHSRTQEPIGTWAVRVYEVTAEGTIIDCLVWKEDSMYNANIDIGNELTYSYGQYVTDLAARKSVEAILDQKGWRAFCSHEEKVRKL